MAEENVEQEYLFLQQQLRNVLIQKEALKLQIAEIDSALGELEKCGDETVYKVIGNIMIKKKKDETEKELRELKDNSQIKINSLERIEKDLIERIRVLEAKLREKGD